MPKYHSDKYKYAIKQKKVNVTKNNLKRKFVIPNITYVIPTNTYVIPNIYSLDNAQCASQIDQIGRICHTK